MQARLTKTMRSPSAIHTAFGDSSKIAWKRWRSVASSSRRSSSLLRSHSSAVKKRPAPSVAAVSTRVIVIAAGNSSPLARSPVTGRRSPIDHSDRPERVEAPHMCRDARRGSAAE